MPWSLWLPSSLGLELSVVVECPAMFVGGLGPHTQVLSLLLIVPSSPCDPNVLRPNETVDIVLDAGELLATAADFSIGRPDPPPNSAEWVLKNSRAVRC